MFLSSNQVKAALDPLHNDRQIARCQPVTPPSPQAGKGVENLECSLNTKSGLKEMGFVSTKHIKKKESDYKAGGHQLTRAQRVWL